MRPRRRQQVAQAAVGAGDGQIAEQSRGAREQSRVAVAAGLLCQGAGDKAFADARWPEHEDVFVILDPGRFLCQSANHAFVQPARRTIVDVFHGSAFQFGRMQAPGQSLILAPGPLLIDQQAKPFQKAQFA